MAAARKGPGAAPALVHALTLVAAPAPMLPAVPMLAPGPPTLPVLYSLLSAGAARLLSSGARKLVPREATDWVGEGRATEPEPSGWSVACDCSCCWA